MNSLQGQFLVAAPKLIDPNFANSVVLLVRHGEEGALGVIINRPLEQDIQSIWDEVSELPCEAAGRLFQGGPCEGPLMVLHAEPQLSQMQIVDGLHFTTEKDMIEQLVADGQNQLKFIIGYAGWAVGQLESEIDEGSWMILPASQRDVFSEEDGLWDALCRKARRASLFPWLDPRRIPDDPSVN